MVVAKSRRGGVVRNALKTVILYSLTNIALLSEQRKLFVDSAFCFRARVFFVTWQTGSEIVKGIQIAKELLSVLLIKNIIRLLKNDFC